MPSPSFILEILEPVLFVWVEGNMERGCIALEGVLCRVIRALGLFEGSLTRIKHPGKMKAKSRPRSLSSN